MRTGITAAAGATLALAVLAASGGGASLERAPASATPLGFELRAHHIGPKRPLFDGRRPVKLSYRFSAGEPTDLEITIARVRSGRIVARWLRPAAEPGTRLHRRWNGVDRRGHAVGDGRYEIRVGPAGRRTRYAGRFRIHGHVFPVDGRHGERGPVGEFGAPRNGGRVHEGFDILAACGTRLVAARGGRVRKAGYDPTLYGWYVLIAGRKTGQRYFYAHLLREPRWRRGDRIRTRDRVGRVGQTGNAASTPCHLHFELREHGRPVDPKPSLTRWDRWS